MQTNASSDTETTSNYKTVIIILGKVVIKKMLLYQIDQFNADLSIRPKTILFNGPKLKLLVKQPI